MPPERAILSHPITCPFQDLGTSGKTGTPTPGCQLTMLTMPWRSSNPNESLRSAEDRKGENEYEITSERAQEKLDAPRRRSRRSPNQLCRQPEHSSRRRTPAS